MLKKCQIIIVAIASILFISCENEVELTDDFVDTTVVYGLLDANSDTQFIKINRAFLEENTNALQLAQNPDELFYDSLLVRLVSTATGETFPLDTITKPKEPGVFSNQRNIIWYTDTNINSNTEYRLEVIQEDGKTTTGTITALDSVEIGRPEISNIRSRPLPLTNSNGAILPEYIFEFKHSARVALFDIVLYFNYEEQLADGSRIPKSIPIPVGRITNSELKASSDAQFKFSCRRFYDVIANSIDPSNRNFKLIDPNNNLTIEIFAADEFYDLYSSINGPIDGLAQVRPEYTNMTNGIGLFASRSKTIAKTFLSDASRQQLRTGAITGNLNFQDD